MTITTTDNIINETILKELLINKPLEQYTKEARDIFSTINTPILFVHEDYEYGDIDEYKIEQDWSLIIITKNEDNAFVFHQFERFIFVDNIRSYGMTEYHETTITQDKIDYLKEIYVD